MIADRTFSNRVVARVRRVEQRRQRQQSLKLLLPVGVMTLIGITWAIAVFDGVIALRLLIEFVALVVTIGNLEQHLGTALLGPFAPVPLVVSLLLFIAAVGWVRIHQPTPPGVRP
jgi:type III secretory pathway component EscR